MTQEEINYEETHRIAQGQKAVDLVLADPELLIQLLDRLDLSKHIEFQEALNIVEATEEWWTHCNTDVIDIQSVAGLITFENSNTLAHSLSNGPSPEIAKALYEELKYWQRKD